jgi:hypothetical protein
MRHQASHLYGLYSGNSQGTVQDGRPGTTAEPSPSPAIQYALGAAPVTPAAGFATYSQGLPLAGGGDTATTVPDKTSISASTTLLRTGSTTRIPRFFPALVRQARQRVSNMELVGRLQ